MSGNDVVGTVVEAFDETFAGELAHAVKVTIVVEDGIGETYRMELRGVSLARVRDLYGRSDLLVKT
jgi:hypothetical protein